jgi:hypothetical protein
LAHLKLNKITAAAHTPTNKFKISLKRKMSAWDLKSQVSISNFPVMVVVWVRTTNINLFH